MNKFSFLLILGFFSQSASVFAGGVKGPFYSQAVEISTASDLCLGAGCVSVGTGTSVLNFLKKPTVGSIKFIGVLHQGNLLDVEMSFQNPAFAQVLPSRSDVLTVSSSFELLECDGVALSPVEGTSVVSGADAIARALRHLRFQEVSSCTLASSGNTSVSESIDYRSGATPLRISKRGLQLGEKTFYRQTSAEDSSLDSVIKLAALDYLRRSQKFGELLLKYRNASDEVFQDAGRSFWAENLSAVQADLKQLRESSPRSSVQTQLAVIRVIHLAHTYTEAIRQALIAEQGQQRSSSDRRSPTDGMHADFGL